jgi:thiamine kinase-like enzyme
MRSITDQAVPKIINEVSLEWMREAMRSAFPDNELIGIELEASVGDLGYLGSIGRVNLTFSQSADDLPSSVIVKFPATDESVSEDGKQLGAYETETQFYRQLANTGVGRAPRHYFSIFEPESDECVLIIEDLKAYRFVSQTEGATIEDCRKVMKALAQMHAAYWESETITEAGIGDIKDWGTAYIPLIEKGEADFRKNFGHLVDTRLIDNWQRGISAYTSVVNKLSEGPCTLMHGDAHIRNLAFDDGHENPVRFYDWQLCGRGPGAYDVLYFFANSMRVEDQDLHVDEMLDIYIAELEAGGIDYSLDQLKQNFQIAGVSFWGFMGWLGNILPPNEATIELVSESIPRYVKLMEKFGSFSLLDDIANPD